MSARSDGFHKTHTTAFVVASRAGFTLVEMLVAVALVLLMMTLFAQVFQGATKAMSQQKGMAENDQKARRLVTLLRSDLQFRTFVDLKPFRGGHPGIVGQNTEANTGPLYNETNRQGYFSISENDPNNNTDDILQFTMRLPLDLFHSGRAAILKNANDSINQTPVQDPSQWTVNLGPPYDPMNTTNEMIPFRDYIRDYVRNQPEFDDGIFMPNVTGRSALAEVTFFLRNGNLYRRVSLIRQAYDSASGNAFNPIGFAGDYATTYAATYRNPSLMPQVPSHIRIGSGEFGRDFDYSAFHTGYYYWDMATMMRATSPTMDVRSDGVHFHTEDSLRNRTVGATTGPEGLPISLGIPALRFGSSYYRNDGGLIDGMGNYPPKNIPGWPREFDSMGQFFGRPTLQESAHSDFGYPGRIHNLLASYPNGVNPYDTATTLTVNSSGVLQQYFDPTQPHRRGEDIVMTNVHEFDIQVFDGGVASPGFVQLGHSGTGHYSASARNGTVNNYDTWHPLMPTTYQGNPIQVPYRPVSVGADMGNGVAGYKDNPDPFSTTDDASELGWIGTDDEIPLKAIQITIRYFDVSSNQMRQLTLVQSLVN